MDFKFGLIEVAASWFFFTSHVGNDPIGHGQTDDGEHVRQQEQCSGYDGQLVHFDGLT